MVNTFGTWTKPLFAAFHCFVCFYMCVTLFFGVRLLLAQDDPRVPLINYQTKSNTERIQALENLNLDRRLALLEKVASQNENNGTFTGLNGIGIVLLCGERVWRATRKKAERED